MDLPAEERQDQSVGEHDSSYRSNCMARWGLLFCSDTRLHRSISSLKAGSVSLGVHAHCDSVLVHHIGVELYCGSRPC